MAEETKPTGAPARITTRRRVTIVEPAFEAAGLRAGDTMTVQATGPGRVELVRVEEPVAERSV